MSKPTITLTIGASASGKSSWAESVEQGALSIKDGVLLNREEVLCNINRNDLRFSLFNNNIRDWSKYKFNKTNETIVTNEIMEEVKYLSELRASIIISDTNLNPKIRLKWQEWAFVNNYDYVERLFPCDWKELVKRNAQREGGLSESLLWNQYKRYMQQFGIIGDYDLELYEEDITLDHTILCDLDGTVADMKGVRKPFEWDKVGEDHPRTEIIDMLYGRAMRVGHITFLSGRDSCCYEETKEWVEKFIMDDPDCHITWDLYMRPKDDWRKDDIIKYELFNNHVRGKYNVDCLFDDRNQVIRMWSVLGIPNIVDVGNYNEEF